MRVVPALTISLSLAAAAAFAPPVLAEGFRRTAQPLVYTVYFDVTLDGQGHFVGAKVLEVTDAVSPAPRPVPVELPEFYLDAAREQLAAERYQPGERHVIVKRYCNPRSGQILKSPYG